MRSGTMVLAVALLAISCGQGSSSGSRSTPSPSPQPTPSTSSSPSAAPSAGPLTGNYGLILSAGNLDLIQPDASVAATVSVASASTQYCSPQHDGLVAPPPVSASNDEVYFRDGDTKIRMVVPPGSAADVTTVPGGTNVISFFSVSPDDQRIAVMVEDVSSGTAISERLYVEDLHGGGNHKDIFTTLVPKDARGTTLWPMGWHQGAIVLALLPACTFEPAGLTPTEWHVSDASTATRIATIRATGCTLSMWPSPAGVACEQAQGPTTVYDWTGKVHSATGPPTPGPGYPQTSLSPTGNSVFFASGVGIGVTTPATQILQLGPGPYATVQGHSACSWIDEDHLLAPDAVIQFPAETAGNLQVNTTATPLAASGVCAGRVPGGL
jgi:hypothetical protein